MDQDPSIKTRILCKKIKKTIRIDKIISLWKEIMTMKHILSGEKIF
jgi:hypothetical protein